MTAEDIRLECLRIAAGHVQSMSRNQNFVPAATATGSFHEREVVTVAATLEAFVTGADLGGPWLRASVELLATEFEAIRRRVANLEAKAGHPRVYVAPALYPDHPLVEPPDLQAGSGGTADDGTPQF